MARHAPRENARRTAPRTDDHQVPFQLHYRGTGKPDACPTCRIQMLYLTHGQDWVTKERTLTVLAKKP